MISRLKSLVAIVDSGGVSRAAKNLRLTQPALTQHIRFLEDHFGKPLLTRKGNSMELSPEGERLYGLAKELLAHYERVEKVFHVGYEKERPLRFSTVDSTMESIVPSALKALLAKHKEVKVQPVICASAIAVREVLAKKIDLAICTIDDLPPGLNSELLFDEPLIFIGAMKHASIRRKKELEKEDFIVFPRDSMTRFQIDAVFRDLNIKPNIAFENIKVSAIVSFIEAGLGVSIVPYLSVYSDIASGRICQIPIETKATRTVGIAYKKGTILSPMMLNFVHCLRKASKELKRLGKAV